MRSSLSQGGRHLGTFVSIHGNPRHMGRTPENYAPQDDRPQGMWQGQSPAHARNDEMNDSNTSRPTTTVFCEHNGIDTDTNKTPSLKWGR